MSLVNESIKILQSRDITFDSNDNFETGFVTLNKASVRVKLLSIGQLFLCLKGAASVVS